MGTSRLPSEDRRRGLDDRPNSPFDRRGAPLSELATFGKGGLAADVCGLSLERMEEQYEIACRFGAIVERVAGRQGQLPSVIAGYCSRRSAWGLALMPAGIEGTHDFEARAPLGEPRRSPLPEDGLGYRRGLMGLDFDRHALAREPHWRDPESNLEAAFEVITHSRTILRRRTTLQGQGLLRASLAAFECGLDQVERALRQGLDVDSPTAGWIVGARGCGQDVLARARFFQAKGWD